MAFEINIKREDFLKELQRVQTIVEERSNIQILTHLLLVADEGGVEVSATNLNLSYRGKASAQVVSPGSVTVNAKNIYDIFREVEENTTINIKEEKGGWVHLRADYATFKIPGLPPDEFPKFPEYQEKGSLGVDPKVLNEMIGKTIFGISTSSEEQRRSLNGALMVLGNGVIKMVTTDGHRLCLIIRDIDSDLSEEIHVVIPRKALAEIRKLLDEVPEGEPLSLKFQGNQIIFRLGHVLLFSRVIDDKYPDYNQVVPKSSEKVLVLSREGLQRALRKVSVLSQERTKPIILSLTNGKMMVKSNTPELGEANDQLNVEYSGEEMEVGYNATYLLDVLSVIDEEKIELKLNEPLSSGVISPVEDKNYLYVVMPMRI